MTADLPLAARIRLAHAAVQTIAAAAHVEVLFVKGPAADPAWYPPHGGSDVDVLVRPSQLTEFEAALASAGWSCRSTYDDSSAWAHAATWWHDAYGVLDVHRIWPGIGEDPEPAFDVLAAERTTRSIAHVECTVPGEVAEVLLLALHAGRSGPSRGQHLRDAWAVAGDRIKADVRALARSLDAEVGLAAGIGELEEFRDHPDHDLWAYYGTGDTNRWHEWRARLRWARPRGLVGATLQRALRPTTATGVPDHGLLAVQAARVWHLTRDLVRREEA